jgi:predicted Na+-dependent transporter
VLLPFFGFCALKLFPQSPATAIALLVVTTSPGGGFSGFWCYLCNADLALSVAMTTASTMLSVVALPLNLTLYVGTLYGRSATIDFWRLLGSCVVVVLAVVCGYLVSRAWPHRRGTVAAVGQSAGVCLMVFGAVANGSSHDPIWNNPVDWFASVCLPVLGGLLAALALAKCAVSLPSPQAVAVAIECCYQNTGLALTIALSSMPPEDIGEASGVPLVYGVVEVVVIPLFALCAWKLGWTYAPASESLCNAIVGNYQPQADGDLSELH